MTQIQGYHAHLYYDEQSVEQAEQLAQAAGEQFDIQVGRAHRKPVGPHTRWSCQLAFKPELFQQVIPWLALNRKGLTVFIHAQTGDEIKDHTDYTLWMGTIEPLNLDALR